MEPTFLPETPTNGPAWQREIRFEPSPLFIQWLKEENLALAASTYQASRLLMIGRTDENSLSVAPSFFPRCMGLFVEDEQLWVASAFQVWRLQNMLPRDNSGVYDKRYVPTMAYNTGEVFTHDLARESSTGRLLFVNTAFSCIAAITNTHSFRPIWNPPFIKSLMPGDLCHLNGLAVRDGVLRYATVCGRSSTPRGWRQNRERAGLVVDTTSGDELCSGLTMPHSPRWHDGRLWVLNSGVGQLGYVDKGNFVPVAFCPGYARGLAFWKHFGIVGLSKPRRPHAFDELPLKSMLSKHHATPFCGIAIFDTRTGELLHQLEMSGDLLEMYDVAILPNTRSPSSVGTTPEELRKNVWFEQQGKTEGWVGKPSEGNRRS